ncbi:hypothetical protein QZH41_003384 [Actinostola sp. cb2023]|nr:hypothetical protein QZH41_003384 [Actinostola sp. cb2023]
MFSDWSDDDSPVGEDSWLDEDSQKSSNENVTKDEPAMKESPVSDNDKGPSFDDVYDPISDDEFEAMYTQSDEEEDAKKDKSTNNALGVEDVDWSSLGISQDVNKEKEPVSHLEKFMPAYVFSRIGISPTLAGQRLTRLVQDACAKPKVSETGIEEPGTGLCIPEEGPKCIGAFVAAAAAKKREREGLLGNLGPCRRALCARRDLAIRKQLGRSSKFGKMALFAASPTTPVDNELFQMSVALYKKDSTNDNGIRIIPSKVGSILLTQA